MNKYFIIVLAVIIVVGGYLWTFYNGLIKLDQTIQGQWAQVENQFQRRLDLIPNLVNSVQGAMIQEQKIFSEIAEARTKYAGAQTTEQKVETANQIESAIGRLLVIMENYPQLKSIEAVQQLMAQLEGTENRIAVERGRYNETVKNYNTRITQMPGKFLAPLFGFSAKIYFEAAAGAEKAPEVQLNK